MYLTHKYTHDRELASSGAPEQLIKVTSGPETPWRGKIPPADAPSHIHLCWNNTLMSASNHSSLFFFPQSKVDHLPSFTRSFALCSEAGRKDSVGGGHSVLEIKQVNFPSDRCSGGQGEEESTPQDTEMSSWQCARTHTHTHTHTHTLTHTENSRVTLHSSPKQYLDT